MGRFIIKESEVEENVWLDHRFFPPRVTFKNDRIELIAYFVFTIIVIGTLAFFGVI